MLPRGGIPSTGWHRATSRPRRWLRGAPAFLALVLACGEEPAPPRSDSTSGGEARAEPAGAASGRRSGAAPRELPPLPEPFDASLTLPIRVPLSLVAERIDAELPLHQAQDWKPLTRAGASPALEARYEVWRDPAKLRFEGDTLHVEVPLRYAARFNARVKNPFGGRWLTLARDQAWGSREAPQRVVLRGHTRVEITRDWQLKLKTTVDPPEHGPPPAGKLCTPGGFKLCVTRASVAPALRERLDAEILPRLRKAASEVDRRLVDLVRLRPRLETLWAQLARPTPIGDGRWVRVEARAAALELRGDADAVIVQPAVAARVSYHETEPAPGPSLTLPPRSPLSALPAEQVELPVDLTAPELVRLLTR